MFQKNVFPFNLDYGWVRWQTAFEMPLARAGFQFVFIYFKGPKPTVDILLDDLYLGEILQPSDWKRNSDILINKNRKRNIQFRFGITEFGFMKMNSILSFSFINKLFYLIKSNLWMFFRVNITGSRYTSDLLPKLKIKVSTICKRTFRLCLHYTISDLSVNQKFSAETFGYLYLAFSCSFDSQDV